MKLTQDWIDFVDQYDHNVKAVTDIRVAWCKPSRKWMRLLKRNAHHARRQSTRLLLKGTRPRVKHYLTSWDID